MENLRVSERIIFNHPLMLGEWQSNHSGYSNDLSEDGISIYCSNLLKKGSEIAIEVEVDGLPVIFVGEVVWAKPSNDTDAFRAGIKILLYPNSLKQIYKGLMV